jgi:hypothetical protein
VTMVGMPVRVRAIVLRLPMLSHIVVACRRCLGCGGVLFILRAEKLYESTARMATVVLLVLSRRFMSVVT